MVDGKDGLPFSVNGLDISSFPRCANNNRERLKKFKRTKLTLGAQCLKMQVGIPSCPGATFRYSQERPENTKQL